MHAIRLGLAVSLVLLGACAETRTGELEARLQGLVGARESDLVRRMGTVPTRVVEQGDTRYVSWLYAWPGTPQGGPAADPDEPAPFCEATFAVEQGRVAGYGLRGDRCGWGGYPRVAPA